MRLRRRLWYLLVPTLACGIVTAVAARFLPNRYQSDTLILVVPQRVPESYVKSAVTTRIEDRLQSMMQQVLNRTRLERIIQDFNLYADERRKGIMEDVVEGMRKDINVEIIKGDAFRLTYTGDDPGTVMRVTERLASLVIEENLRDREVLAEVTFQFFESQAEEARRRIDEKEAELKRLRATASGAALPEADLLEYEVLKYTYKTLLFNLQQSKMAASLETRQIGEQFKVLDPARLPEEPTAPDRGLLTMAGAGVGLALGFVAMFVRRKKLPADLHAAAVSPSQHGLSTAPHVLVFVLLFALLFVLVVVLGGGFGAGASAGADSRQDGAPAEAGVPAGS